MENDFELVEVNNQITLEKLNLSIKLSYIECCKYVDNFSDHKKLFEKEVYDKIQRDLKEKVELNKDDPNSRRIVVSYSPTGGNSDWCTSLIHLIHRKNKNSLFVYQRSMSSDFLLSDLGFFISLAVEYAADLFVLVGSFHFIT